MGEYNSPDYPKALARSIFHSIMSSRPYFAAIQSLVEMVLRIAAKYGRDDIMLWKMDLANAFGLLNILPSSVRLLANELTDNVTLLYIVGLFGWTGTPYAFDVVTRSIRWGVRRMINGEVDMYVDDLIGCSHMNDVANDIASSMDRIRD